MRRLGSSAELSRFQVIRELGLRTPGTYLVHHDGAEHEHVVLETYANLSPKIVRGIDTTARRLESLLHPHVVSVLAVERIANGVCVLSEWVEGVPLDDVFFKLTLGARLRVVVDVLTALSALHGAPGEPIVHGGALSTSAFITRSGCTKLGFAYRAPLCLGKDALAPEALLADEAALSPRTDVYSAGVLLWEAIMGRPLFGAVRPERIIAAQLAGRVPQAVASADEPWVSVLLPVVEKALAIDPAHRFPHIASMAGELRLAVRARLYTHEVVAAQVWPNPSSGVQPAVAAARSATRVVAAKPPKLPEAAPESTLDLPSPQENTASNLNVEVLHTPLAVTTPLTAVPLSTLSRPARSRPPIWMVATAVAVTAIGLAASLVFVLDGSTPRAIARDAAPQVTPVPTVTHAKHESAAPSALPPAASQTRPAASAAPPPTPTSPIKRRRRSSTYNPSSI